MTSIAAMSPRTAFAPAPLGPVAVSDEARQAAVQPARAISVAAASMAVAMAMAAALVAIVWGTAQRQAGTLDGACLALDMAMAHGALDDAGRMRVASALASPANPYFDRIEIREAALNSRCRELAASRWSWR